MAAILLFVQAAMQLAPLLEKAGEDIAPLAQMVVDAVSSGTDPTDAQWQALHDREDALRTQLQVPLQGGTLASAAAGLAGATIQKGGG